MKIKIKNKLDSCYYYYQVLIKIKNHNNKTSEIKYILIRQTYIVAKQNHYSHIKTKWNDLQQQIL